MTGLQPCSYSYVVCMALAVAATGTPDKGESREAQNAALGALEKALERQRRFRPSGLYPGGDEDLPAASRPKA